MFFWWKPCNFRRTIGIILTVWAEQVATYAGNLLGSFAHKIGYRFCNCPTTFAICVCFTPVDLKVQIYYVPFSQAKYSRVAICVSKPWKIRNSQLKCKIELETCWCRLQNAPLKLSIKIPILRWKFAMSSKEDPAWP